MTRPLTISELWAPREEKLEAMGASEESRALLRSAFYLGFREGMILAAVVSNKPDPEACLNAYLTEVQLNLNEALFG